MKQILFLLLLSLPLTTWAQNYKLKKSQVSYTIKYTFKEVEGESSQAKGKIVCEKKSCDALIAVKTKSFLSGNSNRDAHMWEVMKAEAHPFILGYAKFQTPVTAPQKLNLQLEVAGQKHSATVKNLKSSTKNGLLIMDFEVHFKLSHFKVERPKLLTIAIDDLVVVKVHSEWEK